MTPRRQPDAPEHRVAHVHFPRLGLRTTAPDPLATVECSCGHSFTVPPDRGNPDVWEAAHLGFLAHRQEVKAVPSHAGGWAGRKGAA